MSDITSASAQWVELDMNDETCAAVQEMVTKKDEQALKAAFSGRVEFGTAGLRAEMGPGTTRLNDLVIVQTAQGLCKYIEKEFGEEAKTKGVVLGYDHRQRGSLNSMRFALLSAHVFLSRSIKVYLFGEYVPTPFVPFAVSKYGAACGVMVTASHNPKNDDGYKVYWANACQIIPPHDSGIADAIMENLKPWDSKETYQKLSKEAISENPLCINPLEETSSSYFETVAEKLCRRKELNKDSKVKIAYTAMHGIGHKYAKQVFEAFALNPFVPTKEQVEPDPEFPTVAFPNPEEGKGALALAMKTADENDCTLILANDPDADRLAVAEKSGKDGSWRIFTGNEIGTLLGHWQWTNYKSATDGKTTKKAKTSKGAAMVASTVSSKMLQAMGEKEGFRFEECLTGFKWIGNTNLDLQSEGYDVIFSYEEAIGFCVGDLVVDKDGICAMGVFAEMAGALAEQNKTCSAHLEELGNKYGHFVTNNYYVVSRDPSENAKVFEKLRNGGKYVSACGPDGKFKITEIRDLLSPGYDSSKPDKKPALPVSSSSQMITFTFENGTVATLRMSGTEPKLKYYCEMSGPDPVQAQKELDELVETGIRGDLLKDLIQ